MRPSFIVAIILFVVSLVVNDPINEAYNGVAMILSVIAFFSAFVGIVNSGCDADSKPYKA